MGNSKSLIKLVDELKQKIKNSGTSNDSEKLYLSFKFALEKIVELQEIKNEKEPVSDLYLKALELSKECNKLKESNKYLADALSSLVKYSEISGGLHPNWQSDINNILLKHYLL